MLSRSFSNRTPPILAASTARSSKKMLRPRQVTHSPRGKHSRGGPRSIGPPRPVFHASRRAFLLQLDGRALLFELLLELLGLVLLETLLDGLGGGLDQVLGFLEAQAGRRTDDLDDLDLLVAV